jgi:hypothetical protein
LMLSTLTADIVRGHRFVNVSGLIISKGMSSAQLPEPYSLGYEEAP